MADIEAQELAALGGKRSPRNLLDLPLDVLKDIIKEVTHTNDLTSLALCHSALHDLAIPHIYSRFDIVWPDASTHVEPRSGVDALTYGLATLVFGEELFGETFSQQQAFKPLHCTHCCNCKTETSSNISSITQSTTRLSKRRRGNHYAQYTRKFSLGNGPPDWVQEYLISKEGGKMLGTLVAVAVARMHNLETFVWDMPTGVLRDVWMALASLGDRGEDTCKLERIWIRWHDNFQMERSAPALAIPTPPNVGLPPPSITHHSGAGYLSIPANNGSPATIGPGFDRVEHPTFSVLSPLKSLSVLDIDELPYLEEMGILIHKSREKLRELRVGIASHARGRHWTALSDGENNSLPINSGNGISSKSNGIKRRDGVLDVLFNKLYCVKQTNSLFTPSPLVSEPPRMNERTTPATPNPHTETQTSLNVLHDDAEIHEDDFEPTVAASPICVPASVHSSPGKGAGFNSVVDLQSSVTVKGEEPSPIAFPSDNEPRQVLSCASAATQATLTSKSMLRLSNSLQHLSDSTVLRKSTSDLPEDAQEDFRLALRILELERVLISVVVLQRSLDWSKLTELTILDCQNYEQLWRALRHTFTPSDESEKSKISPKSSKMTRHQLLDYPLKLRKLHTNVVSPSLISFLKETLAPNSLEILFLQDSRANATSVTIDSIFRGPLKRHCTSLKKLSIDSSEKAPDGRPITNSRWRKWILNRDVLSFLCSGRMANLRELGMAIEYRDWHYFLQRLPQVPHLRSLYIPYIADHAHGSNIDSRELALQIVDIVTLRPEIELCYMGIGLKCFEILEINAKEVTRFDIDRLDLNEIDHDFSDEEQDNDANEDLDNSVVETTDDHEETEDESFESRHESEEIDDDYLEDQKPAMRLKLREILFYDDKVAIFKARHGRL